MKKNNTWKLDLLEVKFKNFSPRFHHTKRLLTARNNDKLLKKFPTNAEDADNEILALKKELFDRKYYGAYKKLEKEVQKLIKTDLTKFQKDSSKQSIVDFLSSSEKIEQLITAKLVKSIFATILVSKDLKTNPPSYIPDEIRTPVIDKENLSNPSRFFINYCQNDKVLNNYFSNLWNNKALKSAFQEVEWSFRLVRGNLTTQEKEARKKITGKEILGDDEGNDIEGESESDSEGDDEDNSEVEDQDVDEADLEKFAIYDKLVGDSEGEEEDEKFEIDPSVNYNEITDEEASASEESGAEDSDDSFFDDGESKKAAKPVKKADKVAKKEHNLPSLAQGYFSGGSDDEDDFDADNDKVVKEATTQRKNRRGQRARQKIWAQKYGKEAKHVVSERQAIASEREQRQKEYEERCRKREEKARLAQPSGSNVLPLGERKPTGDSTAPIGTVSADAQAFVPDVSQKLHPSWEAKRLAEDKLKNVKFEGKKIKFD